MKNMFRVAFGLVMLGFLSSNASAIFLNQAGLGEVLVYPYYTVNGGNITLFTVFNSTSAGKAIKVRFLEGFDGRDVLDFNLYLSPYDGWVAGVIPNSVGGAALFTPDNSCTVPKLPSSAVAAMNFTTSNFDGSGTQGKDGGPTDTSRTREGHIELIEMGTVNNNSAQQTLTAITHVDGTPQNCAQLVAAWDSTQSGYWVAESTTDIGAPTGGLFGSVSIVNIPLGTVQAYNADAISQFYPSDTAGTHTSPASLVPNIGSATSLTATVFADDKPLTLTFNRGIDAVSALFMADNVDNEFWSGSTIDAMSEWVLTYPTKRFYVDPYFVGSTPLPPFETVFGADEQSPGTSYSNVALQVTDREESSLLPQCSSTPCPSHKPPPELVYESQVLTFNQSPVSGDPTTIFTPTPPSKVLSSSLVPVNVSTSAASTPASEGYGWASIDLSNDFADEFHQLAAADGSLLIGQPVSGFWVTQFVNGDVNGVLANYTAPYRHKTHSHCMKSDGTSC